ncbi:MAG: accessory Sec system protein Asp3 [Lachnospiraceae bacterium]|nr:accessory Sec system protein Asp3 [Lachnospiraceae bacterium]
MVIGSWKIYWNEYASDTYLYGARLTVHKINDVEYENQLMPPGTIIKQWYSSVNFQRKKIEPALPIIDGESRYHISVNIEGLEGMIVRLSFLDRYGQEFDGLIIRGKEMDFRCPLKTYSYNMQLISGGGHYFRFHNIIISELG